MNRSSEIWPFAIMLASVAVIVAVGADRALIQAVVTADKASDWLGFWGGVAGGIMTLAAAALAFGLTRRQVDLQAAELAELREERAARALVLTAVVSGAAGSIIASVNRTLQLSVANEPGPNIEIVRLNSIPTMMGIIGYGELWRLEEPLAARVLELDDAIFKYHSKLEECREIGITLMPRSTLAGFMNDIIRCHTKYMLMMGTIIARPDWQKARRRHHSAASPAANSGPKS